MFERVDFFFLNFLFSTFIDTCRDRCTRDNVIDQVLIIVKNEKKKYSNDWHYGMQSPTAQLYNAKFCFYGMTEQSHITELGNDPLLLHVCLNDLGMWCDFRYYGCITQATCQLQLTVKVGHICFDLYSCNLSNCLFLSEKNVMIYTKTCWKRKFENFEIVYYCRVYIYKLDIRYSESALIKVTNSSVQDVSTVKGLSGRIVRRLFVCNIILQG